MKNNIINNFIVIFLLLTSNLISQELKINSAKIQYSDINKVTIFEGNVNSVDEKGNKIFSEYAKYDKIKGLVETQGKTKIITSQGYEVLGSDVTYDNNKKVIYSDYKTQITDKDGNVILVDMFNYSTLTNIFFSKGNIKILDINDNNYSFSEIYIDETKRKIIGSDAKAYLNQENFLANKNNQPRFFANTMSSNNDVNTFEKGVFTYCKIRKNEKCPPWLLQSEKIKHDLAKKTIYYKNVVLKLYDFPIFYSPKFSHPDPTVKRRSGLLVPTLTSSTALGSGFSVPYFWNMGNDRDLTFTPRLYLNENPLMLAEYRQDFKNSFLHVDFGFTEGYKNTNTKKTTGKRTHIFTNFNMTLIDEEEKNSNLTVNLQKVSNDTYLKVYDIDTTLIDKNQNTLENTLDYTYQNKDFFFSSTPSVFEDMNKSGHLRHEYLLPFTIEKNIMTSQKFGFMDLETNLRVRNYETNKQTSFLVNDFNWRSKEWINKLGLENHFKSLLKTVNYEATNTDNFKNEKTNSELSSAFGYLTKLGLFKKDIANKIYHTLTPKFLLRYAPGHMRNVDGGRLSYNNLFNINKVKKLDVVESGLSSSIGFEYKKNRLESNDEIGDQIFSFSVGQVVSSEENNDMPSSTSLDQKFSDVVGETKYNINDKVDLSYNFSLDQSYKEFNYNEISSSINFNKTKFNIGYLQEKNHIGSQEFVETGMGVKMNNSSELNFTTKRNLLTNSAEFYNLSYNYINDCLKAGIAYRREFYTDRDIEPDNKLMFTISFVPFGQVNSAGLLK